MSHPRARHALQARWRALPAAACLAAALASCVALPGCAVAPAARRLASQAANRAPVTSEPALAQVRPGSTTRDELLALLGPTSARLRLDSGYEVWAYRLDADKPGGPPKGEYVVLLAPTGQVAKTRLRITPVATPDKPPLPVEDDEGQP